MDVDLPANVECVAELQGHDDRAWHTAWNPTKPILASCSADKTVRLYHYGRNDDEPDPGSISFKHVNTIQTGHTKTVRAIAWSPSGRTLATASFDANIGIWEREGAEEEEDEDGNPSHTVHSGEWECMSLLEGHETECKSVAYSSSGNLLASCSRDKTVWVWEVHPDSDFECMGVMMEHSQDVKQVAWHPTEEILASASYDDTIKLYIDDPSEDWFCFATLTGHASTVWSLAFSPNGRYLASCSDDLTIRIWERVEQYKWECVEVIEGVHERSIYSIAWGTGEGRKGEDSLGWLASTGGDGKINVFEFHAPPTTSETSGTRPPPSHHLLARVTSAHGVHDVNSVSWCPRQGLRNILSTAGDDGIVKVWKITPPKES
ncbi:WD40 repeat-like protein [Gloeophyllum trabeum ATCC 11539]|uniref:Probable cytosolic iron-sulfur protein assembly protein 1 n=1 Tax=Gloeophyllum trabeum (strain ATCC 11539 / FP-39264 / Madison 617) TaxID=670483 RepID=S7RLV0_GLOTA|nr:WD40 repeat-like protein [Gloeophyllum trabeum ATCC 11539]EPQ53674.1 WD40 repeat-like protein [Gloeophyllum trabeum ATCC 11539]